jgi:cell wall-associated NlpC family hydrolase
LGITAVVAPSALASTGGTAGGGSGSTGSQSTPPASTQSPTATPAPAPPPPVAPAPPTVTPGGTVPGTVAKVGPDGKALAPADAPDAVKYAIWAGNQIQTMPYVYGGGHASFSDTGYDCSGSVSYALHGAGLLAVPEDSSDLGAWGLEGPGAWITVYTNPGHAYAVIAGLRLDTSRVNDPRGQNGPRWRKKPRDPTGYDARHFSGL